MADQNKPNKIQPKVWPPVHATAHHSAVLCTDQRRRGSNDKRTIGKSEKGAVQITTHQPANRHVTFYRRAGKQSFIDAPMKC